MKITEYKNLNNEAMIFIEYNDGTSWSGYKSAYDALISKSDNAPII